MSESPQESPLDRLWKEYGQSFREFDDLTLARWCSQTLAQLHGQAWRLSHPLVGAYRLASQLAHDRQIWHKRLVGMPNGYHEASCCRAPLLPLFTRDVGEGGLICHHCGEASIAFDDLPCDSKPAIRAWAIAYGPIHQVAHWDDRQRKKARDYDAAFEDAAQQAEKLLAEAARKLVPPLLEFYPAIVWEDQDECLEVRPEDIAL
ncbi:MAG TPA: hypothetical protein VMF06_07995 [Candidatus Limnocylindria bacterium]|jgi:hypothetical protein|nr:hypothetical protein [Candidatus Limnocylindria bacterium]